MKRYIKDMNSMMDDLVPSIDDQEEIKNLLSEFKTTFSPSDDPKLWVELIAEETYEFMEELLLHGRSDNLLKEFCDVIYVLEGFISNCSFRVSVEVDQETERRIDHCYDELMNVSRLGYQFFTLKEIMVGFREVHRSNMSKLDKNGEVVRREDGKVMKSDRYVPAIMQGILDNKAVLLTLKRWLQ